MILTQEYILNQLKQHPNGCTISDMVEMDRHPYTDRNIVVKNYSSKLRKLLQRGYVTRSGHGGQKDPVVWRAVE